ncbi:hypothetical protein [Planotetraspora kaengkrachanensis]|uniref:Uncharacterized protein n=1 Tax=Planotetraspora kaengkrachanensis TaxID=575193 RepID=A0A8J3PTB7_9ACTN|nr:hypothetical protein [Planotetraspora kaengkrachanensis]GIG79556.1 hypothetical protein Pka01_26830 [Planotetraspora kaengkrachanensis]
MGIEASSGRVSESQLVADLVGLDQPGDVIRKAGEWLAAQLADEGFTWVRSQGKLEHRGGKRSERIYLQNSAGNRTGQLIAFGAV